MQLNQCGSAVPLVERRHGRCALPPANIARPCWRYSPADRARLRNRQGMVRLARSADAPAASMPGSRSPTCSSPFVTGHQWPSGRGHSTAVMETKSATIHWKMAAADCQLPITGFAHKAGVVSDDGVAALLVLAAHDMAAERRRAATLDRRHHLELAEADMAGIGLTPCRSMVAEDIRNFQRRAEHRCGRLRWRRVFIVLSGAFAGLLPWLPARL